MYGTKLLWIGLTIILAVSTIWHGLPWELVGGIIMIIGAIALLLDR